MSHSHSSLSWKSYVQSNCSSVPQPDLSLSPRIWSLAGTEGGYKDAQLSALSLGIHSAVTEIAWVEMTLLVVGYPELWGM